MEKSQQSKTKTLVTCAMLGALAFVVMAVGRVPVVLFLKYDPKDVILAIAGFLFGPLPALGVTSVVALLEMFTFSDTGVIGLIMNILSSASFVCTAAIIYQRRRTLRGAIAGLLLGVVCMCAVMLLWNYLITPLYMNVSRQEVAALLLPAFLPFNLLKGVLNASITMLLYKPVVRGLSRAHLMPRTSHSTVGRNGHIAVVCICLFVLASCVLCILAMRGLL
jgi:riboflavin transporter FmnP